MKIIAKKSSLKRAPSAIALLLYKITEKILWVIQEREIFSLLHVYCVGQTVENPTSQTTMLYVTVFYMNETPLPIFCD